MQGFSHSAEVTCLWKFYLSGPNIGTNGPKWGKLLRTKAVLKLWKAWLLEWCKFILLFFSCIGIKGGKRNSKERKYNLWGITSDTRFERMEHQKWPRLKVNFKKMDKTATLEQKEFGKCLQWKRYNSSFRFRLLLKYYL